MKAPLPSLLAAVLFVPLALLAQEPVAPAFDPTDVIPYKKASADFVHPGVFSSQASLDRMREKVTAGIEPWKSAFGKVRQDPSSSSDYKMSGPAEYVNNQSRYELANDAYAAHLNALMWNVTRDERHAARAREILLAWAGACKGETSDSHLQIGPSSFNFASALEILRTSYPGWTKADTDAFVTMWRRKEGDATKSLLDQLQYPYINNHGTVTNAGLMAFGVIAESVEDYNLALQRYFVLADRSNAGIYGNINPETGQNSESNRDQGHSQGQIGDLANAAQIMLTQGSSAGYDAGKDSGGVPLLLKAFQFTACYNLGYDADAYRGWDMGTRWDTRTGKNRDNGGPGTHNRGMVVRMYEGVYNYYKFQAKLDPKSYDFVEQWIRTYSPDTGTLLYSADERQADAPAKMTLAESTVGGTLGYDRIAAASFNTAGGRDALEKNRPGRDNFQGRQIINCTRVGNYVVFKDFDFGGVQSDIALMALRVATNNNSGELYVDFYADVDGSMKIEATDESPKFVGGAYLGRVNVTTTGGWADYKTCFGALKNVPAGRKGTLYMVFLGKEERGRTEWLMNVDWFKIAPHFAFHPMDVSKTFSAGDELHLEDVDFDSGAAFLQVTARSTAASALELSANDLTVPVPVPNTRGELRDFRVAVPEALQGVHSVVLRGRGSAVEVKSIRFTARQGGSVVLKASQHLATSRITDHRDAVRAADGAWMAFSPVTFGAGVRRVSATVASDVGGTIEVRTVTRDGVGVGQPVSQGEYKGNVGTLIASLIVPRTNGRSEVVVVDLPKSIARTYMVYVTFKTAGGAGSIDLSDVQFDPVNVPPAKSESTKLARAGEPCRVALPSIDGDGDPVVASIVSAPGGVTLDATTSDLLWTPTVTGTFPIVVDLSDGQLTTRSTVTIDVSTK